MQLRTEIEIARPPERVWAVLTDTARFAEWNPFVTEMRGDLTEGGRLEVVIAPPEGSEMRFRPIVTVCRPNEELRWRGVLMHAAVFRGEHFFRLEKTSTGGTRFVHGEDFGGFLLRFVKGELTKTARGFVLMNQALKRRAESLD